jgi:hypothetical protein
MPTATKPTASNPRLANVAAPIVIGLVGILALYHTMIFSAGRWVPGERGDARFVLYVLEHQFQRLIGAPGHASLWDMPIFFPAKNTAAFADLLLGYAPFYWPWRLCGLAPDSAFQAGLLALAALNYFAAYRLLKDGLKLAPAACAGGAYLFAFGSPRAAQLFHAQMGPAFYALASAYALVRLCERPNRAPLWISIFFGGLVAQLYSAFYPGWFMIFGLALFIAWALVLKPTRGKVLAALKTHAAAWFLAGAAALILLFPLVSHYTAAERAVGPRDYGEAAAMIPSLRSWIYMGRGSWLYHWMNRFHFFTGLPMVHEQALGVGFATSFFCLAGFYLERRRPWTVVLLLASATLFIFCTRLPGGVSLWRLAYDWIPGAAALRAVSRVGVFMLLPAAIGFAYFLAPLRRNGAALAVVALCAAEQYWPTNYYYEKASSRRDVAALAARIDPRCPAFFYIPVRDPAAAREWWRFQTDAMWASLSVGIPTVNGYSGNYPPGYDALNDVENHEPADESRLRAGLSRWTAQNELDPARVCVISGPVP